MAPGRFAMNVVEYETVRFYAKASHLEALRHCTYTVRISKAI